jgi:hypothetical protein
LVLAMTMGRRIGAMPDLMQSCLMQA